MRVPAAGLLAVAALAACSHRQKPPPPAPVPLVPPLVALEAAEVRGLGFLGADMAFRARIENPNATPLSVVRVEYALDLEQRRAAQGAVARALLVPAASTGEVVLPVQVRYAAVPGVAQMFALGREAEYALAGAVVFLTPAGEVRVPMSQAGRLAVPRTPRFHAHKLLLRSASPREVVLEMGLDVENPNAFEMPAGRVGCGLHLAGGEVVRADVVFAEPIAPGATARAVVPIRISVFKASKAVARFLLPFTSLDASLRGEAVFGGVPVPLDLSTSVVPGA